jgi:mRNA interferase MazF
MVHLDPTVGHETQKTRPCVVLSPDVLNSRLRTCVIAPLTTGSGPGPSRVPCQFQGKPGFIVIDQLRVIDRVRIVKLMGVLGDPEATAALEVAREFFAP